MKEFDFEMLQDEACDKAISYLLSSGFESVTAVDLMYGNESAYIDDSFIAKVKRGIRNITTFRLATKVKNLAKDVDNLSKEKVSQGPTDNVNINYEMFQNFIKFLKKRSENIIKVLPMMEELRNKINEIAENKELVTKLNQMDINNLNKKGAISSTLLGILSGVIFLSHSSDLGSSDKVLRGLAYAGVTVNAILHFLCIFALFKSLYGIHKSRNLNTSDKDVLVLKEFKDKFEGLVALSNKIIMTLIGVNISSKDISGEVKSIADKENLGGIFNASLLKTTQQVSYEEKVKIVDELKSFSSTNLEAALNMQNIKGLLTNYNKIAAKLKTVGYITSETEITLNNSNIAIGYLLNSTEIAMLTLQGVLEDAKKY